MSPEITNEGMAERGEVEPVQRRRVRLGRRPRPVRRALSALGVVLLLGIVWCGVRGALAFRHLEHARTETSQARESLTAGNTSSAAVSLRKAQREASDAASLTNDAVWHLASHLPVAGIDLRTAHQLADSAALLTGNLAPSVEQLGSDLSRHTLRRADGTIDLATLSALAAPLNRASTAMTAAGAELAATGSGGIGPIKTARAQFTAQLTSLQATTAAAERTVSLAPAMLGATGKRRYFIALQNPAEARGTGGLLGAYAIVSATQGRLHVDEVGTDDQLVDATSPVVTLSPDFTARWRALGGDSSWRGANLTPNFPDAATVWRALWLKQHGQQLDGVIAFDPETVGSLLGAVGSVTLPDGTHLSAGDIPAYIESGEYQRYPLDQAARRTQLRALIHDVLTNVTAGSGDVEGLLKAASRGTASGRILIESARQDEQAQLQAGSVAGAVPETPGPFVSAIVNNAGGNKTDFYLQRSLTYTALGCATPTRASTVTLTLRNTAPSSGLPLYVGGYNNTDPAGHFAPGTDRTLLSIYAARGATLTADAVDGQKLTLSSTEERLHPVFSTYLDIAPGQTRAVVLQLNEPSAGSYVYSPNQALSRDAVTSLRVESCLQQPPLVDISDN